jgi:hypothetical protein
MRIRDEWDILDPRNLEFSFKGGGKGSSAPAPAPVVAPTAPVEEASVEIDEETKKDKLNTGKSTLKVPMAISEKAGLKV